MKPTAGRYRLIAAGNPALTMIVEVDEDGFDATFGRFDWNEDHDWFQHLKADVFVRCSGEGTFEATVKAGTNEQATYEGTCVAL